MRFDGFKPKKERKKMMLYIDLEDIETIDSLKPEEMTTQECIRQIIKAAIEEIARAAKSQKDHES